MRKLLILALATGTLVLVLAVPALAQEDDYTPPTVAGTVVEREPATQVGGETVTRGETRGGPLAFTGSDALSLALIGAGAFALGSVLVVGARRRRRVLSRA